VKKKLLTLLLCQALLLGCTAPCAAAAKDSKTQMKSFDIVGEWIHGSTVFEAGPVGAELIASRCAEMGVTDIYLLVKGTGGTISWLKTDFPARMLTRTGRDVLAEMIEAGHAYGIRVHAWICNMEDSLYKSDHPEAGMWHYIRGRDNSLINPYDEGYRAHMAQVVTELASNYDIDGIHLDYIRYNHVTNGWSETDFANLEAMGANIDRVKELIETTFGYHRRSSDSSYVFNAFAEGDPDAAIIARYRQNNIKEYAKAILSAAEAANPDLIFSAALQPETAYDLSFGGLHYGNDYADCAPLYDYVCPMSYSDVFGQSSDWVAKVAKAAVDRGCSVVAGLQSYYGNGGMNSVRLMADIEAVRDLLDDPAYAESVKGIIHFRNSQFGYAKLSYDTAAKTMTVKTINTNPSTGYQWVQIELQKGLRVTDAAVVDGYQKNTAITMQAKNTAVRFHGTDILPPNAEGTLILHYEGELDPAEAPAVVRVYLSNESRAYNVYEDVTPAETAPDTTTDTQRDPSPADTAAPGENTDGVCGMPDDSAAPDTSNGTSHKKILPAAAGLAALGAIAAGLVLLRRRHKKQKEESQ